MKRRFPREEYHVPFFDEQGYARRQCPKCNDYFWTQLPQLETCGEASPEGCASYTFINNPPTRKPYTLDEMRETFLSFFERHGHKRMKPYPVVARWRDDLYLTSASIVDFQPYVTNGIIPPPANPLVISQPCIRLVDVDRTGPTFGRHLTIFEMGGHHAFNYEEEEVYWKDQTVRLHHEFATKELGIPSEEIIYKEDVWSGGGNAGPDLETVVRGLELATLVFMEFKVVNNDFVELPIRTVDTGYGIERFTWISQGAVSGFHTVYGELLRYILELAGLDQIDDSFLAEAARHSAVFDFQGSSIGDKHWQRLAKQTGKNLPQVAQTIQSVGNTYAVADHTKSIVFMLAEGVVPSNAQEGYLARLMIRRTYRLLKTLGIEHALEDIIDLQIKKWSLVFPSLQETHKETLEILRVEREKLSQTLNRGRSLVKRIAKDLKSKGTSKIPTETLLELYDSHGLPPEAVEESAAEEGVKVEKPDDFYEKVAERHLHAPAKKTEVDERLDSVADLPETVMLYYENPYTIEFESQVLRVLDGNQVILEKTAFYPEGGGQPADTGNLALGSKAAEITDVQKVGKVILHKIEGTTLKDGDKVKGRIDWNRRSYLMRAHTATHLIMGAARRVLGQHIWQTGSQKNVDQTRLDISHYQRLTPQQVDKIEALANQAVIRMIPVETTWLPRDEAEARHGFRLYQGGAVPGKEVRVVKVSDWEVEACAGTHVGNTGEVGFVKILHTERIQDGVERIVYSTGRYAVEASQKKENMLREISATLEAPIEKLLPTVERLLREWKQVRQENKQLINELAAIQSRGSIEQTAVTREINNVKLVIQEFTPLNIERMIKTASRLTERKPDVVALFYGKDAKNARLVLMAGREAVEEGVDAKEIAREAAREVGGGGSGRRDFAQGGGTKVNKIQSAVKRAEETLRQQLIEKPQ